MGYIYLDNIQLNGSSATTISPTISNKTTASFSTTLSKPGDFYEFTVDVVNNGSIDAMIDGVTKTPELSTEQAKYINYIVEYQNGEAITTKQLVAKESFVRLKVKVEFRKDIIASDLPTTSETLNLSFTVNYVQSNETGISVKDDGVEIIKIISGDLKTIGSEVCIGDECFYVISSDDNRVTMLSKYNLYVGTECTSLSICTPYEDATGIQDSTMIGVYPSSAIYPRKGVTVFSSSKYWENASNGDYIYDSNSTLYNYLENYKTYLESKDVSIEEIRLIKKEELELLGCSGNSCTAAPEWVYSTSYWSGTTNGDNNVWGVTSSGYFSYYPYGRINSFGVRPVITLTL